MCTAEISKACPRKDSPLSLIAAAVSMLDFGMLLGLLVLTVQYLEMAGARLELGRVAGEAAAVLQRLGNSSTDGLTVAALVLAMAAQVAPLVLTPAAKVLRQRTNGDGQLMEIVALMLYGIPALVLHTVVARLLDLPSVVGMLPYVSSMAAYFLLGWKKP